MKRKTKILSTLFLFLILASCFVLCVYADNAKNGWVVEEDGTEKYYENGNYVTGNKVIGNHTYIFGSDGTFLGMYDGHVSIGTAGTMDSQAFKDALNGVTKYLTATMNPGQKLDSSTISGPTSVTGPINKVLGLKVTGGGSNGTLTLQVKNGCSYQLFERANGNIAYRYWDSNLGSNSDSYLNGNFTGAPLNQDIVIDFEMKLGEDYAPLTGITLPFVSYGGSSFISLFISLAFIQKISEGESLN